MYREPVATIYSQLRYHVEDLDDTDRVAHCSTLYEHHLQKWLVEDSFTDQKTLIRYGRLKADIDAEFAKICRHFSADFDAERLASIAEKVSKQRANERVEEDDPKVINMKPMRNDESAFARKKGRWSEISSSMIVPRFERTLEISQRNLRPGSS
nr:hypothetical protein [Salinibacter ruber]